jgi:hypothetical protein
MIMTHRINCSNASLKLNGLGTSYKYDNNAVENVFSDVCLPGAPLVACGSMSIKRKRYGSEQRRTWAYCAIKSVACRWASRSFHLSQPQTCEHSRFWRNSPDFYAFSPRGIHEISLLQMWRNVINRTDNIQFGIYHLSLNMRCCVISEHQASYLLTATCMAKLYCLGGPMTADLQHLNSLQVCMNY